MHICVIRKQSILPPFSDGFYRANSSIYKWQNIKLKREEEREEEASEGEKEEFAFPSMDVYTPILCHIMSQCWLWTVFFPSVHTQRESALSTFSNLFFQTVFLI